MVLLGETHVFPQLSQIGLFGKKSAFLQLENSDWHNVFLSKTISVLTGKQYTRFEASKIFSLERYISFSNSDE
jgi:hypothetical protein